MIEEQQAGVAAPGCVVSFAFKVIEEGQEKPSIEISEASSQSLSEMHLGEMEQQLERVPVSRDRAGTV